jgi:hypothetical protein
MIVVAGVVIVLVLLLAVSSNGQPAALAAPQKVLASARVEGFLEPFTSPFPGIGDEAWTRYVHAMAIGRPGTITADGRVGIFGMELRRLEDLGYVQNVRKVERDGEVSFEMEWIEPYSLDGFLRDGALQYKAFARSTADHRATILGQYRAAIGQVVSGQVATLSGLLGVTHQAGLGGLAMWLSGQGDPITQTHLTSAFVRTTGTF